MASYGCDSLGGEEEEEEEEEALESTGVITLFSFFISRLCVCVFLPSWVATLRCKHTHTLTKQRHLVCIYRKSIS